MKTYRFSINPQHRISKVKRFLYILWVNDWCLVSWSLSWTRRKVSKQIAPIYRAWKWIVCIISLNCPSFPTFPLALSDCPARGKSSGLPLLSLSQREFIIISVAHLHLQHQMEFFFARTVLEPSSICPGFWSVSLCNCSRLDVVCTVLFSNISGIEQSWARSEEHVFNCFNIWDAALPAVWVIMSPRRACFAMASSSQSRGSWVIV